MNVHYCKHNVLRKFKIVCGVLNLVSKEYADSYHGLDIFLRARRRFCKNPLSYFEYKLLLLYECRSRDETAMYESELIWVLDSDPKCLELYREILGLQYNLVSYSNVDEVLRALRRGQTPSLMICDPLNCQGAFARAYSLQSGVGNEGWRMPETMIVSNCDDLEVIRFYFRAGVREFILKPVRSGELIAKVERVLQVISNREVLILPNSLDGVTIQDLTFREHQIFTVFLTRPKRTVRRDELYNTIWGGVSVGRKTLDVHVFNLRRKLRVHGYDILCKDQCFTLTKIVEKGLDDVKGNVTPSYTDPG